MPLLAEYLQKLKNVFLNPLVRTIFLVQGDISHCKKLPFSMIYKIAHVYSPCELHRQFFCLRINRCQPVFDFHPPCLPAVVPAYLRHEYPAGGLRGGLQELQGCRKHLPLCAVVSVECAVFRVFHEQGHGVGGFPQPHRQGTLELLAGLVGVARQAAVGILTHYFTLPKIPLSSTGAYRASCFRRSDSLRCLRAALISSSASM